MKPTLVVLAAGMGSRYGGVKQIDAIGRHNECLLDFSTYDAMVSGFGKVVYIIRKDIETDFRERLFDRVAKNFDAEYVFQTPTSLFTPEQISKIHPDRKKPWGTMHAVLCAKDAVHEPFSVINADDYYGREAFKTIGAHLSAMAADGTEHAMVGYVLENTMSRTGSVSRGVCKVSDSGYLESITENTKIYYQGDRIISEIDGQNIEMTGKEWVSMNMFGFGPKSFETFSDYWNDFVKVNGSSEKGEAYLPTGASNIINQGRGQIKFYTSSERWFGMTYSEDREIVKQEIDAKISSGYYPETLWTK